MSGKTSGDQTAAVFDPKTEAQRIAFDRSGNGEEVLLISGFPQTRRSWGKLVRLLSKDFQTVAADLPSFGESGLLPVPATTEKSAGSSMNSPAISARRCTSSPTTLAPGWPIAGLLCFRATSGR
jgi:pimeloyl-ACP methyl ester carboxylesterase